MREEKKKKREMGEGDELSVLRLRVKRKWGRGGMLGGGEVEKVGWGVRG
jgi:hypothetical protein